MKVLIVDDNFQSRRLAHYILSHLGHEVHTIENAVLSLELLQKDIFDLIVLDWSMPGLNGSETLVEYDKLFQFRPVKQNVIIYSGYPLYDITLPSPKHVSINTYISKKQTPHRQMIHFKRIINSIEDRMTA